MNCLSTHMQCNKNLPSPIQNPSLNSPFASLCLWSVGGRSGARSASSLPRRGQKTALKPNPHRTAPHCLRCAALHHPPAASQWLRASSSGSPPPLTPPPLLASNHPAASSSSSLPPLCFPVPSLVQFHPSHLIVCSEAIYAFVRFFNPVFPNTRAPLLLLGN